MAQEYSGGISIATGFKLNDPQPIDDRLVVATLSDLSTLPNVYAGIVIAVASESYALYRWNGNDQTQSSNWIEVGSGGSSGGSASIINYTPTSATDNTYPVGTFTYDTDFIYSRVSSTAWKKAYLYAFTDTSGGDSGSEGDTGGGDTGGETSSIMSGSWEFKPVDSDGVFTDNETLNNLVSTLSFGSSSVDDVNFTAALNAVTTSNTLTLTDGTSSVEYGITSISTTEAFATTNSSAFSESQPTMQLASDIYDVLYLDDINKYLVTGNNKSYILNEDLTFNMNNAALAHYNTQNFKKSDGTLIRTMPNSNGIYILTYEEYPVASGNYAVNTQQTILLWQSPYNIPSADWHIAYHPTLDKIYVIGSNLNIEVYSIATGDTTYSKTGSYSITPPTEGSLSFKAVTSTLNESGNTLYIGLSSTNEVSSSSGYSNYIVNWNCNTDTQGVTWSDSSVYTSDFVRRGHLRGYKMVFSSNLNKIYYEYQLSSNTTNSTQIYSIDVTTGVFTSVLANILQGPRFSPTQTFGGSFRVGTKLVLDPVEDFLIATSSYPSISSLGFTKIIELNSGNTVFIIYFPDGISAARNTLTNEIFIPSDDNSSARILTPTYTPSDKVWNFSVSYSTGNNANWTPALGDTIQVTLT